MLGLGALVAVAAVVGSGFAVQSSIDAKNQRVAETSALTEAGNPDVAQLGSHSYILSARADNQAETVLATAKKTLASAKGKVDAADLSSSVAALGDYEVLDPSRVFDLAGSTKQHADKVSASVAEFDRKAAEKAAAEKAAAEKAAAEEAAREAAEQAEVEAAPAAPAPSGPANPTGAQATARDLMSSMYGWGGDQFGCLVELWNHESGWNVYASNPSGAYGIPQALPGSKMASAGPNWESNASTQIKWGLGYISGRYGTPCGAWSTFNAQGWY